MQLADISLKKLHKIGQEKAKTLAKMGLKTIGDLLWHFPWRYDDLSEIKDISQLEENVLATVRVKILSLKTLRSWKRKIAITEVLASDGQDQLKAIWFGQKFVGQILKIGDEIFLSAKPSFKNNLWQFSSPAYDKVKKINLHSARLVPVYHSSFDLSQKQLRFLISLALKHAPSIADPLPVEILNQEKYPYLHEALQAIHFPEEETDLISATKRLKFQELFYLQCKYQLAKKDYLQHASWPLLKQDKILKETIANLPFTLTSDQTKVLAEILVDLAENKPMNRLVEGDVGSGKT
ncbi:MAG: RecG-like protein helicase, partial [Parcubacteria group bacterium GW2011_GWA2_36_10]